MRQQLCQIFNIFSLFFFLSFNKLEIWVKILTLVALVIVQISGEETHANVLSSFCWCKADNAGM